MQEELRKKLSKDPDGLLTYEYIANHIGNCDDLMPELVENMIAVDRNGQFLVSAVRYLHAISPEHYNDSIRALTAAAIEKDRERKYIGELLSTLYGPDYIERQAELSAADDNFRRIIKRIYPQGI